MEIRGPHSGWDNQATRLRLQQRHRRGKNTGHDKGSNISKAGTTSNRVRLKPQTERKERARGKTMERTREERRSRHRLTSPGTRACVTLEVTVETKVTILEMGVVDPDGGLDHLLDHLEDPVEVDLEGRRDRPEADRQGRLVGLSNRLRPCSTPTRMGCSTLHRRLGILRHSKAWHFRSITNEGT